MQGVLALALYRMGRQADALRTIDACRAALRETSGLDIGAGLRNLEQDMLSQSSRLDSRSHEGLHRATPDGVEDSSGGLVGRVSEMAVLARSVTAARRGHGGVALVIGEPGAGKTRLAEAALASARAAGIATVSVRCPESRSVAPFWLWQQLLEPLNPTASIDAGDLDGDRGRAGIYQAVLDTLRAAPTGFVALIDDLQWAEADSLRVLTDIAADLATTPALIVATMRPLATDASDALVECLAEIARSANTSEITLSGLTVADVAAWLHEVDPDAPLEVATLIHDRTAGNALFVNEVVEMLRADGSLHSVDDARASRTIPASVSFVVRRRASRLPPECQQVLVVAAVLGGPIDVELLADAAGISVDEVGDAVAPALDARLLVEKGGMLSFSHALVADALAAEVNPVRRAAMHATAARSLARRAGPNLDAFAVAIAHHAREGLMAGTGQLAIEAGSHAAQLAAARWAHEDAAAEWDDVANLLLRVSPDDQAAYVRARTAQAAALAHADRVMAAKQTILNAAGVAERAALRHERADALALFNQVHVWTNEPYGVVDVAVVDALNRAVGALGDDEHERRALLLGALAAELTFADRVDHERMCRRAVETARRTGDPAVVARVLNNTLAINRPDTLDERGAVADEILTLAEEHDLGKLWEFVGRYHRAECHLERGRLRAAEVELGLARRCLQWLPGERLQGQVHWFEAALALATGRYDDGVSLVTTAHELHRRGRVFDADALLFAGLAGIAIDRGGLEAMAASGPVSDERAEPGGYARATSETMAFAALEAGDPGPAHVIAAAFGPAAGFGDDYTTLYCATAALHVRVEIGDLEGAAPAASLLEPFVDRWAGAGTSPLSMGPIALAVARHRAALGDHDEADQLFAAAISLCETAGAPAWLARSLAHASVHARDCGDNDAATALATRSRDLAEQYALPYVARRLTAHGW